MHDLSFTFSLLAERRDPVLFLKIRKFVFTTRTTMDIVAESGSRTTTTNTIEAIEEYDMYQPILPNAEQIAEIEDTSPDRRRREAFSRPQLIRSNYTLKKKKEDRFLNKGWSQSVVDLPGLLSEVEEQGIHPQPVNYSLPHSIPRKPVNYSRPRAMQTKKPQENVQKGLVNEWWNRKVRAWNIADRSLEVVPPSPTEALDQLLTESSKALLAPAKDLEIWVTEPDEDDGYSARIFPNRHEEGEDYQTPIKKATSSIQNFLTSLPLVSSPLERASSSKKGKIRSFDVSKLQNEPQSSSKSKRAVEPLVNILEEEDLATCREDSSSIWASQLAKDLDEIDTSYNFGFETLGRTTSHIAGAPTVPGFTGTSVLSEEISEMDEEINELNQDIASCTSRSVSPGFTSSSSTDDDCNMDEFEIDRPTNWDDDFCDPNARLTARPLSPNTESKADLHEAAEVQQWMQSLRWEEEQSATSIASFIPEGVNEDWAECYLPVAVLNNDPRYANRDVVCDPRLAQMILINRTLCPKRRNTKSPRRDQIVIQAAPLTARVAHRT